MIRNPQQPLIGIIFISADSRYASILDDKQGSVDTVQMGFPFRPTGGRKHEERTEDSDSSQRVRDHVVVYHLASAITGFVLDEN